ncbi:MAG: glycosyltransferase family 39 protein, partial [Chloroflexi bacterium]|nr:glycosyltransferase family 39 protein [Chloroflexota bacterium]
MLAPGRWIGPRRGELALAGILLLAAFLRLFGLQNGQYGSDDERLWSEALRSLAQHTLPAAGIRSSIGVGNGPFQVFVVMPAAALFGSAPLAGAVVVGLLNVLGVYVLYRLVLEQYGRRPALIAALLYATSSWAVIYARRMQAQDMLAPFEILFFWNAARWLRCGRARDLVLMGLWLAVLSQVYVLGLLHFLTAALILAIGWPKLRPLPALCAAAVLAVLSAPYALTVLLPGIATFRGMLGGQPTADVQSIVLALTLATHKGYQTIAGQAGSVWDATANFEGVLVWVEEALFALGALYVAARLARSTKLQPARSIDLLLLVWTVIPVALFVRHSVPLYPYYYVSILPLPAVFTALLLDRFWRWGGAAVAGVLAANSLALAGIFFAVIGGYWTHNDYGLPEHLTIDVSNQVRALAQAQHVGRTFVDGDMDPSEVMGSVLIRDGLDVLWLDDYRTPELASPPAGSPAALYVTMADDTATAKFLKDQFGALQQLAVPLPGEGVTIRAYVVDPAAMQQALEQLLSQPLQVSVANGMQLQAFYGERRVSAGQPLQAAVSWVWGGGTAPKPRYSLFAHLIDGSGKPVAQADFPLLAGVDWRPRQEVVQWLNLALPSTMPPGRYSLDLGVYDEDGVVREALTDPNGKELGTSLSLGPFVVPPADLGQASGAAPQLRLGDGIDLLSHGVSASGGQVTVNAIWAADASPSKDYTVFVHLLDGSGKVAAQVDTQPRGGDFPTSI